MTTTEPAPPPQPPPEQPVVVAPPPPEEPPEEDSALLPALLVVYAAYLLWRGAHDAVPSGWRQVALALNLRGLIGTQLAMIAARALDRQRRDAGRAGDELWTHVGDGVRAGVDAGLQAVAEALIWTDRNTPGGGDPVTKDADEDLGGGTVPTAGQPPEMLAGLTALAVVNAAVVAVATLAGWRFKTWQTRRDARVREAHAAMDGQRVAMSAPFLAPGGIKLRFPGDPRAPIELRINCRCWVSTARR